MFLKLIILVVFCGIIYGQKKLESSYMVEHSFSFDGNNNSDIWLFRSELIIDHSSRSGSLNIHEWNDDEINELNKLINNNNNLNGYYKLKINNKLINSIKLCQLINGNEYIILHTNNYGNLIGFDYLTTNPLCLKNKKQRKINNNNNIPLTLLKAIDVTISFGIKGDEPFIPEYQLTPPQQQQKSIFQRYWYIILIVGFMLVSNIAGSVAGAK